jgi:hypothetical protein
MGEVRLNKAIRAMKKPAVAERVVRAFMIWDLLTVFGGFGLFLKLPRSKELGLHLTRKNMECSKRIKKSVLL